MKTRRLLFLIISGFFSMNLHAEQKVKQGVYELHYNAFPSTFLSKEVANAYQITRSKNRGIINISVLDTSHTPSKALEAEIDLVVHNLLNQNKDVKLIKITKENQAVYYMGSFALNNQEDVNFRITVTPKGTDEQISARFSREFYTD